MEDGEEIKSKIVMAVKPAIKDTDFKLFGLLEQKKQEKINKRKLRMYARSI